MNSVAFGGRVYGVTQVTTKSGVSMTKFRLQVSRFKKEAMYIDVVSFDKNADFVNNHVKEGSGVFVAGKLDEDTWMKDEVKQYRLKVVADRVEFLPVNQKKDAADADNNDGATKDEVVTPPTKDDF